MTTSFSRRGLIALSTATFQPLAADRLTKEDLRFIAGDQWQAEVRLEREKNGRPCLVFNQLPRILGPVYEGMTVPNKRALFDAQMRLNYFRTAELEAGLRYRIIPRL